MEGVTICKSIIETVQSLIHSEDFKTAYRIGNCFTRKRKLGFENLMYFLLHQSKKSMSINIIDFLEDFPQLGIQQLSKQAVAKARKGIHIQAFQELMRVSCSMYYQLCSSPDTWHGYRILAIDGTTLQMPQTKQNLNEFGTSTNQTGTQFAMASASVLFDVMNDIIIDAQMNICNYSERAFALKHLESLDCLDIPLESILIFDRGYPSFDMFEELTQKKQLFVMRLKNSTKAMEGADSNDIVLQYGPKYPKGHDTLVRVVRFSLEGGGEETLITNIFDPEITVELLKELYFLRWGIEGKYQELKDRLQLENFSGSSSQILRQDFYLTLFFSNLVSIMKRTVDEEIAMEVKASSSGRSYQVNRGFLINRIKKHLVKILTGMENVKATLELILLQSKKIRSQIRPNRKYERKTKLTRRKHHHNRKPCI